MWTGLFLQIENTPKNTWLREYWETYRKTQRCWIILEQFEEFADSHYHYLHFRALTGLDMEFWTPWYTIAMNQQVPKVWSSNSSSIFSMIYMIIKPFGFSASRDPNFLFWHFASLVRSYALGCCESGHAKSSWTRCSGGWKPASGEIQEWEASFGWLVKAFFWWWLLSFNVPSTIHNFWFKCTWRCDDVTVNSTCRLIPAHPKISKPTNVFQSNRCLFPGSVSIIPSPATWSFCLPGHLLTWCWNLCHPRPARLLAKLRIWIEVLSAGGGGMTAYCAIWVRNGHIDLSFQFQQKKICYSMSFTNWDCWANCFLDYCASYFAWGVADTAPTMLTWPQLGHTCNPN